MIKLRNHYVLQGRRICPGSLSPSSYHPHPLIFGYQGSRLAHYSHPVTQPVGLCCLVRPLNSLPPRGFEKKKKNTVPFPHLRPCRATTKNRCFPLCLSPPPKGKAAYTRPSGTTATAARSCNLYSALPPPTHPLPLQTSIWEPVNNVCHTRIQNQRHRGEVAVF